MYRYIALIIGAASLLVAGCGDSGSESSAEGGVSGEITVFAAASLTDAFREIGEAFEAANEGVSVEFNFAGSQALRTQIEQGAPADVYAPANATQMDAAVEAGQIAGEPVEFTRNDLVVIVPRGNEAGIETLEDLARPGLKIVLAQREVPAGQYSRAFLEAASADGALGADYGERVLENVVSEETNVRQVVTKVQLDEADAGIVYASDVTGEAADDLVVIEIPERLNQIASYPMAVTKDAGNPEAAAAFIDFVLSSDGVAILTAHGFRP